MYHIVFHSPRHKPIASYYRGNSKVKKDSTHNQFELDTIRGSIKSRWELFGYGHNDIQSLVWNIEEKVYPQSPAWNVAPTPPPMHGHIITVETAADVIWFRMNHEHVAKHGCKMTEIYKDIDKGMIQSLHQEMKATYAVVSNNREIFQYLNQTLGYFSRIDRSRQVAVFPEEVNNSLETTWSSVEKSILLVSKEVDKQDAKMKAIGKKMRKHLESCRTTIV